MVDPEYEDGAIGLLGAPESAKTGTLSIGEIIRKLARRIGFDITFFITTV